MNTSSCLPSGPIKGIPPRVLYATARAAVLGGRDGAKDPFWNVTRQESRSKTGCMKWNLEKLSWRYAALIGIVTPESAGMTEAEVSADRERWPHLIETHEGSPVLHLDNGARWMAEVSGAPVAKCRRVISEEWG
jgi:hypothetical protein